MNYLTYCKTRLAHARTQLGTLNEDEADSSVLLANINSIRNIIFEILDYLVNHYKRNTDESYKVTFPIKAVVYTDNGEKIIPKPYGERIKEVGDKVGQDVVGFINQAYSIIENQTYGGCILLLDSASKHRNKDEIIIDKPQTKFNCREVSRGTKAGVCIKLDYHSNNDIPIKIDMYGQPKLGFIHGGSNMIFGGLILNYTDRSFLINLITTRECGKSLLIRNNGGEFNVRIKPFLENCINCSEEIINLWSNDPFNVS